MIFNKQEELEKLRLVIFPCSDEITVELVTLYDEAYGLWDRVWAPTLFELDGVKKLYSNEFSRHDFCSVLLRDNEALSLLCYSTVNLTLRARQNDSWFSAWPKELIQNISERWKRCLMPAWLAVNPDYRRTTSNYPINTAQIIMEAYAKILLDYDYDAGFGTARNDRGVGKLIYNTGGEKIQSSVDHGVSVDLVLMKPENIKNKLNLFSDEFKMVWERREDYWVKKYERTVQKAA